MAGDLWQWAPPRGTFLGDVPWEMLTSGKSKRVAHTVHGQELVWGRRKSRALSKASRNLSNVSGRGTLGCKMCKNSFEMGP